LTLLHKLAFDVVAERFGQAQKIFSFMAFQEFLCPKARPVSGHEFIRAEQIFSLREI